MTNEERADELKETNVKQVWKYKLNLKDNPTVRMPAGAQPLSVGMQGDELMVWALVDPEREEQLEWLGFRVAGTGHPIEAVMESWKFMGTVQCRMGLVWHVWLT